MPSQLSSFPSNHLVTSNPDIYLTSILHPFIGDPLSQSFVLAPKPRSQTVPNFSPPTKTTHHISQIAGNGKVQSRTSIQLPACGTSRITSQLLSFPHHLLVDGPIIWFLKSAQGAPWTWPNPAILDVSSWHLAEPGIRVHVMSALRFFV